MKITEVKELTDGEKKALSEYWITTAEQFYALYCQTIQRERLRMLLKVNKKRFKTICESIINSIAPEQKAKFGKLKVKSLPTGGRKLKPK